MTKCRGPFSYGNPGPGTAALLQCVRDELLAGHARATCSSAPRLSRRWSDGSLCEEQRVSGPLSPQEDPLVHRPGSGSLDPLVSRPRSGSLRRSSSVGSVRKADLVSKHRFSLFEWPSPVESNATLNQEKERVATAPTPMRQDIREGGYVTSASELLQSADPSGNLEWRCSARPAWLLSTVMHPRCQSRSKDHSSPGSTELMGEGIAKKTGRAKRVSFHPDCKAPPPTSILSLCREPVTPN